MKKVYFRIIEIPDYQILLKKDFGTNNEEADFLLVICFFFDNIEVKQTIGYELETSRDSAFDLFSSEDAQNMIEGLDEFINK